VVLQGQHSIEAFWLVVYIKDRRLNVTCIFLVLAEAGQSIAAAAPFTSVMKWTMMRHGNRLKHLGRPADQRKALLRALTTEVLRHGQIRTTKVSTVLAAVAAAAIALPASVLMQLFVGCHIYLAAFDILLAAVQQRHVTAAL
jgi:hypothetical protein